MFKYLFLSLVALCAGGFAIADGLSNAEMKAYLAGCKKALRQAKPDWNPKDVNMICADPRAYASKITKM